MTACVAAVTAVAAVAVVAAVAAVAVVAAEGGVAVAVSLTEAWRRVSPACLKEYM